VLHEQRCKSISVIVSTSINYHNLRSIDPSTLPSPHCPSHRQQRSYSQTHNQMPPSAPLVLFRRQYIINDTGPDSTNGIKTGAIVGFVCAGIFIILILIWGCWRRSRRTQNRLQKSRPGYADGGRLTKLPSYAVGGIGSGQRMPVVVKQGLTHDTSARPGLNTPTLTGQGVMAWDVSEPGTYDYACRLSPSVEAEGRNENRFANKGPMMGIRRPESVVTTATTLPPSYEEVLLSSSTRTGARRLSRVR
jgi:hypothetical protein